VDLTGRELMRRTRAIPAVEHAVDDLADEIGRQRVDIFDVVRVLLSGSRLRPQVAAGGRASSVDIGS